MSIDNKRITDYSKESLIKEIKRVAKELGKEQLSRDEFDKNSKVSSQIIRRIFESWPAALREAGLKPKKSEDIADERDLFEDLYRLSKKLQRLPILSEMVGDNRLSRYSFASYKKRFKSWSGMIEGLEKWINIQKKEPLNFATSENKAIPIKEAKRLYSGKGEYGEPINFQGLRHAPLNELGVVFLFGMLCKELGYEIEAVKSEFPDCEGKRRILGKGQKWEKVYIEFEYKSSNFKTHGHNPEECHVIVCWEHDWKDCPIEVISLKDYIK